MKGLGRLLVLSIVVVVISVFSVLAVSYAEHKEGHPCTPPPECTSTPAPTSTPIPEPTVTPTPTLTPTSTPSQTPCKDGEERLEDDTCQVVYPPEEFPLKVTPTPKRDHSLYPPPPTLPPECEEKPCATPIPIAIPTASPTPSLGLTPPPNATPTATSGLDGPMILTLITIKQASPTSILGMPLGFPNIGDGGADGGEEAFCRDWTTGQAGDSSTPCRIGSNYAGTLKTVSILLVFIGLASLAFWALFRRG